MRVQSQKNKVNFWLVLMTLICSCQKKESIKPTNQKNVEILEVFLEDRDDNGPGIRTRPRPVNSVGVPIFNLIINMYNGAGSFYSGITSMDTLEFMVIDSGSYQYEVFNGPNVLLSKSIYINQSIHVQTDTIE